MKEKTIHGKRILLVDDQPSVRGTIRLMLELDDHIVTEANNGAEALDLFTPGQFDLVTTDFAMPVMKGNELAVRIKQMAPMQPILMITGYAEELGDADNPVDSILKKPFTLESLRGAVAMLLAS